jgi:hypothetical protein
MDMPPTIRTIPRVLLSEAQCLPSRRLARAICVTLRFGTHEMHATLTNQLHYDILILFYLFNVFEKKFARFILDQFDIHAALIVSSGVIYLNYFELNVAEC